MSSINIEAERKLETVGLDHTCQAAVENLESVVDDASETARCNTPEPQEVAFQKGSICIETRTAFSALKDFIRWHADRSMTEAELLQFGHEFGEYRLVRDALSKAVDRLKELGAGDDDDYLQSVISKLELMPD